MDESDPRRPPPPDLHDLTRQLHERKVNLLHSAGREADLRWTVERLRLEVEAAARREAVLRREVESAEERLAAIRTVLDACAASAGPFGLRRRRFLTLVRQAAAALPNDGPLAARHAVLLAETRRLIARSRG